MPSPTSPSPTTAYARSELTEADAGQLLASVNPPAHRFTFHRRTNGDKVVVSAVHVTFEAHHVAFRDFDGRVILAEHADEVCSLVEDRVSSRG